MLSKKTIAFLAALLALLLAANRLADRHLAGRGAVGLPPPTLLPQAGSTPFSAIAISNGTATVRAVRVSREGRDGWVLPESGNARAGAARVELAIDTIARARILDRVTARQRAARGLSPADFGFEPVRASVTLERASAGAGAPTLVEFGADTPGGDGVFARVDGSDNIYAVERAAFDGLPSSADDLRDRVFFVPPGRAVASIVVRDRTHGEVRLESAGGGAWRLTSPYACSAAPSAVEPLLRNLSMYTAERFVAAGEALDAGLSSEETPVSLSLRIEGEPRDRDFYFGKPDPAAPTFVYASSLEDGSCFTVDRAVLDALTMPLDVLREHRILPYDRENLERISFDSAAGVVELARESGPGSPWAFRRPSRQPADPIAVAAFLDNLLALQDIGAEPAPTSAPPALASVRISLVPSGAAGPESFDFTIERSADGATTNLVVTSPARSLRQLVDAARAPAAAFDPSALAALRSRTILALPAGAATGAGPAFAPLLTNLQARAVAALAPSDPAAYGLLPPRAELPIRTSQPDRPVVILQLGAALADGGAYLRVKGADAVFEVEPAVADVLSGASAPDEPR